jgi:FkbM family methyltransferase
MPQHVLNLARRALPMRLRHWARHPWQSVRWLLRQARFSRTHAAATVRMRDDWVVRCHPSSVDAFTIQRDQPDLGEELRSFIERCAPGMVFVDIGAHFGLFTLAALHYSQRTARVVAIDPSAHAMELFVANLSLAGRPAAVESIVAAVMRTPGPAMMLASGVAGFHMMVPSRDTRPDAVRVPGLTLDEIAASRRLRPTHVKVDVEGSEEDVLAGGRAVLRECRPILFLELHAGILRRQGRDPAGVFEILRECGYHRYEIGGRAIDSRAAADSEMARLVCIPDLL